MKKVTVSKLQIAQAKECSARADRYRKGIDAIISMCEVVLSMSQYNKLPDDFKTDQKNAMRTIVCDLKLMYDEAFNLSLNKQRRASELEDKRAKQLEEK